MEKTYEDKFVTVYEDMFQIQKVYKDGGTMTSMKPEFMRQKLKEVPDGGIEPPSSAKL